MSNYDPTVQMNSNSVRIAIADILRVVKGLGRVELRPVEKLNTCVHK